MEKHYEERDQFPELINGGQVDEAIVNTPPTEKGVFNTGITSTQIEQVVDLPIPTTDDSGKVLKVDAEGKWELATDSEGIVVVANPTLAGTEANLTGLQVGATKYKVPEGMEVLELSGGSGTLTDAQYELANSNKCIIILGGMVYYKHYDDGNSISYMNYLCLDTLGKVCQSFIAITKSTKEYVFYIDGSVDTVQANPTLAGNEPSLTSLLVGSTKYKITTLYKHKIRLRDSSASNYFYFDIISARNSAYTYEEITDIITNYATENQNTSHVVNVSYTNSNFVLSRLYTTFSGSTIIVISGFTWDDSNSNFSKTSIQLTVLIDDSVVSLE